MFSDYDLHDMLKCVLFSTNISMSQYELDAEEDDEDSQDGDK